MNVERVCKEFCSGLRATEVPMGLAIATPFKGEDGDALSIYMRKQNGIEARVRFEEDGQLLARLAEEGFTTDTQTRSSAFNSLLKKHNAFFDEDEWLIHSEYVEEEQAPAAFLRFLELMVRIDDLKLLSKTTVARAFKDDLKEFLDSNFSQKFEIQEEERAISGADNYVSDFVMKTLTGRTLAIYAVSSEVKALEALLLWQEAIRLNVEDLTILAVLESAKPQGLRQNTMSRLMNSDINLAAYDNAQSDLVKKMERQLEVSSNG